MEWSEAEEQTGAIVGKMNFQCNSSRQSAGKSEIIPVTLGDQTIDDLYEHNKGTLRNCRFIQFHRYEIKFYLGPASNACDKIFLRIPILNEI
jgi:hypothetical protein